METKNKNLKLFISYCHKDEDHIDDFKTHIAPLKDNGLITEWYDRKITGGENLKQKIDNNLSDADIICLFISARSLSSNACKKEKKDALELEKRNGVAVIPIILSDCSWQDDMDIKLKLAFPTDGKPIEKWESSDSAWKNVCDGLKKAIEKINKIKNLKVSSEFERFLNDAEMLTKAHSQKETIKIDDIFIYPEFIKHDDDDEKEKNINSEKVIKELLNSKTVIAGENQSGKTTLCKMIFKQLREKNFIPVYISDKNERKAMFGIIDNRIKDAFREQYQIENLTDIDEERIVPIIDDFHLAKHKEKHINNLEKYPNTIFIVDDIYSVNIKNNRLLESFTYFRISELNHSLRNKLIKKWMSLLDNGLQADDNYQDLDKRQELVNRTLGKVFGAGIMPAYPFFVLNIISLNETFNKPLDEQITSQGYCYQALIYIALRKENVKNEHFDIYINFLTEFSFYLLENNTRELSKDDFEKFVKGYKGKYNFPIDEDKDKHNFPIDEEEILNKLQNSSLLHKNSFNYYSFSYKYIFYFFVSKYLAEHLEKCKTIIDEMISNLHKDENAYITIFITHHTKDNYVLDEVVLNAMCLFDGCNPATLKSDEMKFFDEKAYQVIEASLSTKSAEENRAEQSKIQDAKEKEQIKNDDNDDDDNDDDGDDDLGKKLRRSIKTVEVMGHILKNRAGSLLKDRLEEIFMEGMNLNLRTLQFFLEAIKDPKSQQETIEYLEDRIKKVIDSNHHKKISSDELRIRVSRLFWNMNFAITYGLMHINIRSLGSDLLINIVENVCKKQNTPATFHIEHGIKMFSNKNPDAEKIKQKFKEKEVSITAKKMMQHQVVHYASLHKMKFKDRQMLENKLGISIPYHKKDD